MLELKVDSGEFWDEKNEVFITSPAVILKLEHSLISLEKWEATWKKPFLTAMSKAGGITTDEWLDYIRCMSITPVDSKIYMRLNKRQMETILGYINDPMTATWFSSKNQPRTRKADVITAEIIYYKMILHGIPFECNKWHLNRLLTLIRVCDEKNAPAKKMSKRDAAIDNARINAMRKAKFNSRG